MTEKPKRRVPLVRSSYQPSKKGLEEPVEFPEEMKPRPWSNRSISTGRTGPIDRAWVTLSIIPFVCGSAIGFACGFV